MKAWVLGFLAMSLTACLEEPATETPSSTSSPSAGLTSSTSSELKEAPPEEIAAPYGYWVCSGAPCIFTWTGEGNALIRCNNMCRAAVPSSSCHFSEELVCE